jgi:hypothetical protein
VTSNVRVIERMETSPYGRRLNQSGRLPQTIFMALSTAPQFLLIRLLQRIRQEIIKNSFVSRLLWSLNTGL